jgi:hypothetical protein
MGYGCHQVQFRGEFAGLDIVVLCMHDRHTAAVPQSFVQSSKVSRKREDCNPHTWWCYMQGACVSIHTKDVLLLWQVATVTFLAGIWTVAQKYLYWFALWHSKQLITACIVASVVLTSGCHNIFWLVCPAFGRSVGGRMWVGRAAVSD